MYIKVHSEAYLHADRDARQRIEARKVGGCLLKVKRISAKVIDFYKNRIYNKNKHPTTANC
jgi:hypothetical protein